MNHFDTDKSMMKLHLIFLFVSFLLSFSDGLVLREKRMWQEDDRMNSVSSSDREIFSEFFQNSRYWTPVFTF